MLPAFFSSFFLFLIIGKTLNIGINIKFSYLLWQILTDLIHYVHSLSNAHLAIGLISVRTPATDSFDHFRTDSVDP